MASSLAAGERVVTSLEREGVRAGERYVADVIDIAEVGEAAAMSPAQTIAPQIVLAGIERVFHIGDSEVHALRTLDLSISAGEYVAGGRPARASRPCSTCSTCSTCSAC